MQKRNSSVIFKSGLIAVAIACVCGPVLAKQALPPQITAAIKTWQQCAAAAYKAQKQVAVDRNAAADASFASCQAQFDMVVARAAENGLKAGDVRQALNKSKAALKKQMTAHQ
jgi:hypothetical protein